MRRDIEGRNHIIKGHRTYIFECMATFGLVNGHFNQVNKLFCKYGKMMDKLTNFFVTNEVQLFGGTPNFG